MEAEANIYQGLGYGEEYRMLLPLIVDHIMKLYRCKEQEQENDERDVLWRYIQLLIRLRKGFPSEHGQDTSKQVFSVFWTQILELNKNFDLFDEEVDKLVNMGKFLCTKQEAETGTEESLVLDWFRNANWWFQSHICALNYFVVPGVTYDATAAERTNRFIARFDEICGMSNVDLLGGAPRNDTYFSGSMATYDRPDLTGPYAVQPLASYPNPAGETSSTADQHSLMDQYESTEEWSRFLETLISASPAMGFDPCADASAGHGSGDAALFLPDLSLGAAAGEDDIMHEAGCAASGATHEGVFDAPGSIVRDSSAAGGNLTAKEAAIKEEDDDDASETSARDSAIGDDMMAEAAAAGGDESEHEFDMMSESGSKYDEPGSVAGDSAAGDDMEVGEAAPEGEDDAEGTPDMMSEDESEGESEGESEDSLPPRRSSRYLMRTR